MRVRKLLPIMCVCYLSSVLGARVAVPNQEASIEKRIPGAVSDWLTKLAGPELDKLKSTAEGATASVKGHLAQALGEAHKLLDSTKSKIEDGLAHIHEHAGAHDEGNTLNSLDNPPTMGACAEQDCKRHYFLGEMARWFKQALTDAGVFIGQNPVATAALLIGVSVLIVGLITSGFAVVPAIIEAVGFGVKGPIKNSLASAFQSKVGVVKAGSVFALLQSAAMRGVKFREIHRVAVVGFLALGLKLANYNLDTPTLGQSLDLEPQEWKYWQGVSRTNFSPEEVDEMAYYWGNMMRQGCVAYGNRQYQASVWYAPGGKDTLSACLSTPATIEGLGFKTPLGCSDEGPKKGVIGTWYVPTNGSECMPHWSTFEDEGCILYGERRKFARLLGLGNGDNWTSVCESTPAVVDGRSFDSPSYCEDKGVLGIFGVFDFIDEACECSCVRL